MCVYKIREERFIYFCLEFQRDFRSLWQAGNVGKQEQQYCLWYQECIAATFHVAVGQETDFILRKQQQQTPITIAAVKWV